MPTPKQDWTENLSMLGFPAISTHRQGPCVTIPLSPSTSTRLLLRRLFVEAVGPYRTWIILALVCMACVAGATAATAKLMEPIVNDVFMSQDASLLWPVAGMVLVTFAVKGSAEYAQSVLMARVGLRIITDLQQRLFSHLMGMDTLFFTQNTTGTLVSRFLVDIHHMRGAVSEYPDQFGQRFSQCCGVNRGHVLAGLAPCLYRVFCLSRSCVADCAHRAPNAHRDC